MQVSHERVAALCGWYNHGMDPIEFDEIQRARKTPQGEKLWQAAELMALGIRMMRRNLRRRYPMAPTDEIEARLRQWMLEED